MSARCAIWARVSTGDQETANQLAALRAEAARRGLDVAAEYVLEGLSAWTGAHRGQLRRALDDARAGRYAVLLVWALDRLERGGIEQTLRVMRQLRECGVRLWGAGCGVRRQGLEPRTRGLRVRCSAS